MSEADELAKFDQLRQSIGRQRRQRTQCAPMLTGEDCSVLVLVLLSWSPPSLVRSLAYHEREPPRP